MGIYFEIGADFNKLKELEKRIDVLMSKMKSMDKTVDKTAFGKLEKELSTARREYDKLGKKLSEYVANQDRANRATDESTSGLGDMNSMLLKLGGTAALIGLAKEVINVRSEFQQLEIAFTTMLKSGEKAKRLMSDLQTFAANTPFGLDSAAGGAKQLIAYGSSADTIIDELTMLGDIAAGTGQQIGELVYLYGTLRMQGRAYLMDIRQFAGRGLPIYAELAKVLKINEGQVNEFVSAGKVGFKEVEQALKNMTSEGGQFGGLMKEQSKAWTGQIEELKDNISSIMNEIGKSSEGAFSTVMKTTNTLVANYETVGKVLTGLVATYGAYRAAVALTIVAKSGLTAAEIAHYAALSATQKAQSLLNKTIMANPYAIFAAAIMGMAFAVYNTASKLTEAEKAQKRFNTAIAEAEKNALSEQRELAKLRGELAGTTKGTEEYNKVRDQIVSKFGKYHQNLKDEIDSVGLLDTTYKKLTDSILKSFGARQYESFAAEQSKALDETLSKNLGKIQDRLLKELGEEDGSMYYAKIREALLSGSDFSSDVVDIINKIQDKGTLIADSRVDSYINNIRQATKATEDFDKKARIRFGIEESVTGNNEVSSPVLANISKEIKETTNNISRLKKEISDLRSGNLQPNPDKTIQQSIEERTKALKEYESALETLTGVSKKALSEQSKALEGSVNKIKEGLQEAQKGLESATTDEERTKFKDLISSYEEDLKSLQNKIALLGHDVVLDAIDGIIKGVNVAVGKLDTKTAQEKLFGVLDTSDLDKFRSKNRGSGVERSVTEWNDLEDALSRVNSQIDEVAGNIGGTAGEILKTTGVVATGTLSIMNNITRLSELSSKSIAEGASMASKAVNMVERASVILAIISAAMQIMQQLSALISDAHQQYLKFAEKVSEINKMRDAVNEYRLAVMEAQRAEKSWFAADNLNSLREARVMHEEIMKIYGEKLTEAQAVYQNEQGGGWLTTLWKPITWLVDQTYGKLYGFDINKKYEEGMTAAINNLRIETRKKSKGILGTGIGAKSQKTEDLQTWINNNKNLFAGLDTNLFDSEGLLNEELAKSILENYGDKLVGQTKETLESLVELKEKYDEYIEQLQEYVSSLYEPLVNNFVDSLWDWFDEGKNALDSFKGYAKDTFRDIVTDMMRSIILKNVVGSFGDDIGALYEKYAKGDIKTEEELARLIANRTETLADNFENQLPALKETMKAVTDVFKNAGFDLKETDSDNTLKGAYAKASQESINLLAGQTSAQRVLTQNIDTRVEQILALQRDGWHDVSRIRELSEAMEKTSKEIAETNAQVAKNTEGINSIAQSLKDISTHGLDLK